MNKYSDKTKEKVLKALEGLIYLIITLPCAIYVGFLSTVFFVMLIAVFMAAIVPFLSIGETISTKDIIHIFELLHETALNTDAGVGFALIIIFGFLSEFLTRLSILTRYNFEKKEDLFPEIWKKVYTLLGFLSGAASVLWTFSRIS